MGNLIRAEFYRIRCQRWGFYGLTGSVLGGVVLLTLLCAFPPQSGDAALLFQTIEYSAIVGMVLAVPCADLASARVDGRQVLLKNEAVFGIPRWQMPFFAGVGMGYLASLVIARLFILKEKTLRLVIMGLGLEILAICLLKAGYSSGISSVLLGLGLGLIMPEFLVMFVKLSHHCQRGTANTTHLLAGEAGITLGIAVACYMDTDTDQMFYIGQIVASVALLFFVLITYPYYIKKKVR